MSNTQQSIEIATVIGIVINAGGFFEGYEKAHLILKEESLKDYKKLLGQELKEAFPGAEIGIDIVEHYRTRKDTVELNYLQSANLEMIEVKQALNKILIQITNQSEKWLTQVDKGWYVAEIEPHHAGFGMYTQANGYDELWFDFEAMFQSIRDNLSYVTDLEIFKLEDDAELPKELEDIRGSIYYEKGDIYGYVDDQGIDRYFAIVEVN